MARNSLKNVMRLLNDVTEERPIQEQFLSDLKRSIELDDRKESRLPSQTYKPSSMKCIRNMYFQVNGDKPDDEDKPYTIVGICNSGSDIHERIQTYVSKMKDNGIDCEYIDVAEYVKSRELTDRIDIVSKQGMETKLFHKSLNMSFLCDGIIKYKNKYYILELKTEASFKWQNRVDTDPSHYNQGTAYSIAFNIPEIIFVYINRDVLDMKSYLFVPTDEMKAELITKISECNSYLASKTIPPKPDNVHKNTCNYCNYKTLCNQF